MHLTPREREKLLVVTFLSFFYNRNNLIGKNPAFDSRLSKLI